MATFLRFMQLSAALIGLIALLIVGPAFVVGIVTEPRVWLLGSAYFIFFLGTVWRVVRFGQLVDKSQDVQVQETAGRIASILTAIGLVGVHWLAVIEFARGGSAASNLVLDGLSLVLLFAAVVVSQTAIRTLGQFFDRLTIKENHRLVTEGIYAIVRHPIYTSYILLFVGYCLMLHSFLALGLLVAVCCIWFGSRIPLEEAMLERRFGEEYRQYCQQSNRLFPYLY
jgi:protein-S-isoprenylcysteine O-methyltransferase Ste14